MNLGNVSFRHPYIVERPKAATSERSRLAENPWAGLLEATVIPDRGPSNPVPDLRGRVKYDLSDAIRSVTFSANPLVSFDCLEGASEKTRMEPLCQTKKRKIEEDGEKEEDEEEHEYTIDEIRTHTRKLHTAHHIVRELSLRYNKIVEKDEVPLETFTQEERGQLEEAYKLLKSMNLGLIDKKCFFSCCIRMTIIFTSLEELEKAEYLYSLAKAFGKMTSIEEYLSGAHMIAEYYSNTQNTESLIKYLHQTLCFNIRKVKKNPVKYNFNCEKVKIYIKQFINFGLRSLVNPTLESQNAHITQISAAFDERLKSFPAWFKINPPVEAEFRRLFALALAEVEKISA